MSSIGPEDPSLPPAPRQPSPVAEAEAPPTPTDPLAEQPDEAKEHEVGKSTESSVEGADASTTQVGDDTQPREDSNSTQEPPTNACPPPPATTLTRPAKSTHFNESPEYISSSNSHSHSPPTRITALPPATNSRSTTTTAAPSSSSSSTGTPTPTTRRPPPTLKQTAQDLKTLLKTFLIIIPSSLRRLRCLIPSPLRRLAAWLINQLAMVLHKRGALASSIFYDLMVFLWKSVITIFFREIRSRGAWKVPGEGEGAVIFVVGPHHNQFLDPLLLMSEVRREAGRRISFLVAAKSMDRKFIGGAAKLMHSIPVARAQDLAKPGRGTISLSPSDSTILLGHGTTFLADFATPRCQVMLPRNLGNVSVEVVEVLEEGKLRIKKEFAKKAMEGLREKGEKGVSYKILPHVDQTKMYSSVYQKLTEGGCIGIFPEGGSHDRTDLLPLKAGVSIMALGALSSNPNLRLRIVPVGLSYFHPHKFRSRAVVEFGSPIEIPGEWVGEFDKGGEEKKKAIGDVMELVVDGLKSVTIRAPDYETLMLIQATRRLYRPPGQHLTLGQIVELNKRFIAGYEVYKDEPRLIDLVKRVKEYNTLLRYMGLKDHQIEAVARPWWRSFVLLCYRLGLLSAWGILALPGVVLNAPIFIAAKIISRKKAKEALAASTVKIKGNDVLATWKVLVALAGAPTLYTIYAIGATVLAFKFNLEFKYKCWAPVSTLLGLPVIGYSALKFGEVGMDVYKSLRPLLLSVLPGNTHQLDHLRTLRASLQLEINQLVEELAPAIFDDFYTNRIAPPSARPQPTLPSASAQRPGGMQRRRSTYGPKGEGTFFTHPMSWVDEYLFGWSQSQVPKTPGIESDAEGAASDFEQQASGTRSGYVSGYTTEEPDYDEVINILSREQGHDPSSTTDDSLLRYRRNSRSRSRSQLDLTALNAVVKDQDQQEESKTTGREEKEGVRERKGRAAGEEEQE